MDWMIAASFIISGLTIGINVMLILHSREITKTAKRRAKEAQRFVDELR